MPMAEWTQTFRREIRRGHRTTPTTLMPSDISSHARAGQVGVGESLLNIFGGRLGSGAIGFASHVSLPLDMEWTVGGTRMDRWFTSFAPTAMPRCRIQAAMKILDH